MLTAICWIWLFFVLGGFFLTAAATPELEHRSLAIFLFGLSLLAAIFLIL